MILLTCLIKMFCCPSVWTRITRYTVFNRASCPSLRSSFFFSSSSLLWLSSFGGCLRSWERLQFEIILIFYVFSIFELVLIFEVVLIVEVTLALIRRGGGGQICPTDFQNLIPLEPKVRLTSNKAVKSSLSLVSKSKNKLTMG